MAKTLRRLGDLSPQQEVMVAALAHAVANKLLHEPIVNLKTPQNGYAPDAHLDWVGQLFGLDVGAGSTAPVKG